MSSPPCSEQPVRIAAAGSEDECLAARSVARLLITASTSRRVELVARRIHLASVRTDRPFVQERARDLPLAAGPLREACSDLLDAAAGGSVLLSDVDEMPETVQELLIGLLEELEHERDVAAAVRLVSGSTVSLLERVLAGTFSAQLFYRLNVIHVVTG
jgi:two-component system C4-dicarboxylate transport response regulator DctD